MDLACPVFIAEAAPGLCRQFDIYCERVGLAFDAEPLNALSGLLTIIVAGAAIRLHRLRPNRDAAGLIWAMIVALALGGVGAFLFHTTATVWALWLDMMPFLVFMLLVLWLTLTRHYNWPWWGAALALLAFFAVTFGAGPLIPRGLLPGGAYYLPPLAVLLVVTILLWRRGAAAATAYGLATVVFAAALAARELDEPLCAILPFGTHFLWHVLAALLTWILIRAAILYAPPRRIAG